MMLFVLIVGWSAIVLLNLFWLVWGFRYDGPLLRFVRSLWFAYAAVPVVVGGVFALSLLRSPLRSAPEPFSSDWRPVAYFAAAICLDSLIAVIGVIALARRSAWNASSGGKV